ncbi:MAG: haloacid dehalogenase, partial [Lachnospiraceae bacterium]|nr:haloacid dehalogenase [Lachnospiraceae bacterium]
MDGTIYLDEQLFDGVPEFLELIRSRGGRYLFLTNNSSRGLEGYLEKMKRLSLPAESEDFLTSADAAVRLLQREYAGRRVYVMRTESLKAQLRREGILVCDTLKEEPQILLAGFDRELTFQKLEDACRLLGQGAEFLATNPDWVCPVSFGFVPD